MYSVTSGFLSAINDTDRDIDVYVILDGVTYTADSIVSMRYQHGVLTDRYEVGQVPAAYVEIVLKDVSTSTVIDNKSLTPYIGVNVSGAYEYVPLGVFTVDASERNMSQITIHAMDRMVKLESAYTSSLTYPAQLSAVLAEVLSGYTSSITLPSYLSSYTVNKLDGLTKRQVLSYIASISGANAYVDRTGVFKFKNYPTSPSTSPLQSINGDTYFKFTHEDVTYGINQVVLTDGTSSWTASNVPSGNTSFSLNVYSEYAKSTIATDIKNMLAGTPLLTYQLDFVGNPALELGDNIEITEYIDDVTTQNFYINVGQIDLTYDGRINGILSGVGESKQSNSYASPGELMSTVNNVKSTATTALNTANSATSSATNAQSTADGKNTVFYNVSTSAPVAKKTNDVWFVTDQSNKIRYWTGSAWVDSLLGTNAIANQSITNALIADATIQSAKIGSVDAGTITAGTINADRIGARTVSADKLQIGDFTNLCQINPDGFVRNYSSNVYTHTDTYKYFRVGTGAYSRIWLIVCEAQEFNLNDEYFLGVTGWKESGITGVSFYARYYYTDGSTSSAGSTTVSLTTTNATVSATLKITAEKDNARTLSYVVFAMEKDSSTTGYFYVRNMEIRKRYTGSLMVDGTITTNKLVVQSPNMLRDYDSFEQLLGREPQGYKFGLSTCVVTDEYAYHGLYSLKTVSNAANTYKSLNLFGNNDYGWIKLTVGKSYILSAYVMTTSTTTTGATIVLQVREGKTNSSIVSLGGTVNINNTNGWTRVSCIVNNVGGTDPYANLYVRNNSSGITTYWDAIQLEEVVGGNTTPSAFSTGGLGQIIADNIIAGTIDAGVITVNNLNATNITSGSLSADRISANSITAAKIAAGTITADKLVAGTITAASGVIGSIDASKITTGKLSANYIEGGTLTLGGSGNTYGSISLKDSANAVFGGIDYLGVKYTGSLAGTSYDSTFDRAKIEFNYTTSGVTTTVGIYESGLYFNKAGTYYRLDTANTSAMRITTASGYMEIGSLNSSYAHFNTDRSTFYFYKELNIPNLFLRNTNAIKKEDSTGYFAFATNAASQNYGMYYTSNATYSDITMYIHSAVHTKFGIDSTSAYLQSLPVYTRTGATASNVQVNSAGTLYRVSSALKYKLLVEEKPYSEKVLELKPKTWFDKATVERAAEFMEKELNGEDYIDTDQEVVRRNAGLIAEELEAVGLDEYCIYGSPDENGNRELESIMYDRIWVELIPIIKNQKEEIETLKQRLDFLELK